MRNLLSQGGIRTFTNVNRNVLSGMTYITLKLYLWYQHIVEVFMAKYCNPLSWTLQIFLKALKWQNSLSQQYPGRHGACLSSSQLFCTPVCERWSYHFTRAEKVIWSVLFCQRAQNISVGGAEVSKLLNVQFGAEESLDAEENWIAVDGLIMHL